MTAFFGFLEICKPQSGETVLVNGAAGAVGSLVGQIAKIKVGGDFTTTAMKHMKQFGRMSICGCISGYNATSPPIGELPFFTILINQLKVEGFMVMRWMSRWSEGQAEMDKWINEGKIKYKETITEGFNKMPEAFMGLFEGSNTGKAVVKV
ncbi:hypothetical protein KUTeg_021303 [Tegillarca granosa]|uniref:15-oxoprostaglandin 13-reductase n=1 Tax=Tegillarca granosa TaxID=220873 RepID=A0ABQ9EAE9_TEGGR|nr:hypothetical protein KUTeg_021303 [Tegillarca granosa]